jgi:hypothetical protein
MIKESTLLDFLDDWQNNLTMYNIIFKIKKDYDNV